MDLHLTAQSRLRPHDQRGLSLVELMISMTIGLLLLLGISQLIVQQNSTRNELEKSSRQIENGRYATQVLQDDIQLAGYYGTFNPPGNSTYTATTPCGITWNQGWVSGPAAQVPVPIYGYPGGAAAPLPCLPNYQPNTAVLVIRHMGTTTLGAAQGAVQDSQLPATQADGTSTYLQVSHCPKELPNQPFVLGTAGFTLHDKNCTTVANILKYYVRIYYVSSCDVCTPSDNIPTLKMVENNNAVPPVAVVEGIENMQFDYGLDNQPAAPAIGDGYPDTWTTTPLATDWPNVMAIRINLLARNTDRTTGYTDNKTYCLTGVGPFGANGIPTACASGSTVPNVYITAPRDNYKRHLYSQLVRAINPIGRRANP